MLVNSGFHPFGLAGSLSHEPRMKIFPRAGEQKYIRWYSIFPLDGRRNELFQTTRMILIRSGLHPFGLLAVSILLEYHHNLPRLSIAPNDSSKYVIQN